MSCARRLRRPDPVHAHGSCSCPVHAALETHGTAARIRTLRLAESRFTAVARHSTSAQP